MRVLSFTVEPISLMVTDMVLKKGGMVFSTSRAEQFTLETRQAQRFMQIYDHMNDPEW